MNNRQGPPSSLGMGSGDTVHPESVWLGRLRDGELTLDQRKPLEAHLASCELCRARLADLAALQSLLRDQRAQAAEELPADFAARVMAVLPPTRPAQPVAQALRAFIQRHRDALALGLFAAAAAACLVVVFAPGLRSPEQRPQEAAENEAQIHSLEVTNVSEDGGLSDGGPADEQHAIVLESAEGNTVIWLLAPAASPADDAGVSPRHVP